jgi:hypothetical protein
MTNQDYLEHAEECDRFAAMAKMPANRRALLASAEMWRAMAGNAKQGDCAERTIGVASPHSDWASRGGPHS